MFYDFIESARMCLFTNIFYNNDILNKPIIDAKCILILNIDKQKQIKNGDLDKFVNLKELSMNYCSQDTISDGFLDKVSLKILNMAKCS